MCKQPAWRLCEDGVGMAFLPGGGLGWRPKISLEFVVLCLHGCQSKVGLVKEESPRISNLSIHCLTIYMVVCLGGISGMCSFTERLVRVGLF